MFISAHFICFSKINDKVVSEILMIDGTTCSFKKKLHVVLVDEMTCSLRLKEKLQVVLMIEEIRKV